MSSVITFGLEDKQGFLTKINQVDMYNTTLCFYDSLMLGTMQCTMHSDINVTSLLLPFVLHL